MSSFSKVESYFHNLTLLVSNDNSKGLPAGGQRVRANPPQGFSRNVCFDGIKVFC
jgi:hypothetical protein